MTEVLQYSTGNELEVSASIPDETAAFVCERATSPYSTASETAILAALEKGWSYGLETTKVDQHVVTEIARVICLAERVRESLEARGITIDDLPPSEARALMRDTYPIDIDYTLVLNTVDQSARAAIRHVMAIKGHNATLIAECAEGASAASESSVAAV